MRGQWGGVAWTKSDNASGILTDAFGGLRARDMDFILLLDLEMLDL